jgi:hypothetical protein
VAVVDVALPAAVFNVAYCLAVYAWCAAGVEWGAARGGRLARALLLAVPWLVVLSLPVLVFLGCRFPPGAVGVE